MLLVIIHGNKKLPIWEFIFPHAQFTFIHILCTIYSEYWLPLDRISPWPPRQPRTLFLSSLKSGTFLSCSELSSHRCPDVPFLHPSPHLFCTLALNWINTITRDCQNVCISCIVQDSTHAFLRRKLCVEKGKGKECERPNVVRKVINLDWLFFY